ncbi:methyltransferase domain-containing protein [Pseudoclavibacter chungangensis]|uniref:Methyltransferase domain-containing protein n=1 Tax=Pseudoclavibacter chungangensis TaxID=587635 RepID=A0A7J5C1H2_9MICO|nr:class I SAM-dependent methyltransferase [Pseudoclavibacter chungangensis]KAB1662464.1 methyltransferase domain-containing protein [Pseudoclavibacter chungangensis]NYJ68497.1 SAM-dependent methyltransferase [Pseudoclavibacter chungangensis]
MTPVVSEGEPADDAVAAAANLANWEERTGVHERSAAYGIERFVADPGFLSGVVCDDRAPLARAVGRDPGAARPLDGLDLVHLQYHIGTDTLSLARLGADVTGVDFSPAALDVARRLFAATGTAGSFVESDVTRAADAVARRVDVVYTSIGTITWFRDLEAWAAGIAGLLRPGGVFFIRDAHPQVLALDDERDDGQYVVRYRTIPDGTPDSWDETETYTGDETPIANSRTFEWPHSLGEIVTALLGAGLRITGMHEGTTLPWRPLANLVERGDGTYELPSADRGLLPLSFTITAVAPGGPATD